MGFVGSGVRLQVGVAFAECGEQYPENRTRGAVYGYEFGVTNRTGLRNQIRKD